VIREDMGRLAFALCDGVSQSFMGDLAARLLGEGLIAWLWDRDERVSDPSSFHAALDQHLRGLVERASDQVRAFQLPAELPPMVVEVLEQKRLLGSESTFAAGLLNFSTGQVLLAWMGDSRLRVWGRHDTRTIDLGDTFHTRERWSSRQGLVGQSHLVVLPLLDMLRLDVYSDGLAALDDYKDIVDDQALDALIRTIGETPASDDISFLEIRLSLQTKLPETVDSEHTVVAQTSSNLTNLPKAAQIAAARLAVPSEASAPVLTSPSGPTTPVQARDTVELIHTVRLQPKRMVQRLLALLGLVACVVLLTLLLAELGKLLLHVIR
jgi:hypothetical protein